MNIVIIEDEQYTAEDLEKKIKSHLPDANIQAILKSVKESIAYLKSNEHPHLFFSDIQLGDGLSFEIFKALKITAPVIFITAYDEYALQAFKANGIDYILKPFDSNTIATALHKFKSLTSAHSVANKMEQLLSYLNNSESKKTAILVYQKEKIIPINNSDVALFYTDADVVRAVCFDGKRYNTNLVLEELTGLVGNNFFRVNRQYLVNKKAIEDVSHYFARKLKLNLSIDFAENIIISKEKSPLFLEWLTSK